ncbi:3-hydroxyacyl-ACP dehydratase FabZ [Lacticaseibacillus baoqingensis]|uniref:3-hydroxyacyl-[acyl-carrier-protein] dehydratase FabZ n=1 Tax=Lacticaseibacillus baoqingensis TaxID=2486013 RepID=A0ABW4E7V8_9LACO|nr:3-hydroxyacyl-ACP dehydratase FabZ [Lacticaseibacillus baoqingensis]
MLEAQEIMAILPHRYPMLLVDRVLESTPGVSAVAIKNVSVNEAIFQGHFPGNPIFPGVLQIEALAQTGAIALLQEPELAGQTVFLGGIRKAKFRKMVRPGDTLRLEVTLTRRAQGIGSGVGRAFVGEELACMAELVFAIQ